MTSFYEEDLAYVHHVGFAEFAEGAGREILGLLREAGLHSGCVVDLGCGSGIWARRLTDEGYEVRGVDISEPMVRLARGTAPRAEFRVGSLYEAEIPSCVAVTALGEALNYGTEGDPSERWLELFRKIHARLAPGGVFAFDVLVQGEPPMQYRSWSAGADWAVLVDVSEERERERLVRDVTIFRDRGHGYRRSEERHVLAVPHPERAGSLLTRAGFPYTSASSYGDYALRDRRLAFVARKAGPA